MRKYSKINGSIKTNMKSSIIQSTIHPACMHSVLFLPDPVHIKSLQVVAENNNLLILCLYEYLELFVVI